jgi:hypothetical protein
VVQGPNGTTIAHGEVGERGAVGAGTVRAGNVAGVGRGVTRNWSSADMRVQGNYCRDHFNNWNAFGRDWYHNYPHAWFTVGRLAGTAWTSPTWDGIDDWFGSDWPAYGYSYGDDITYANNNVYYNGQPAGTAADYYQEADNLAQVGEQANIPNQPPANSQADSQNPQWLPLGVFEAQKENEKTSDMIFQLAVNKAGIIRGNYFNPADKNVQTIEGAVDKKTQRVSWVVEDQKKIIFDTGLYNLTKDEAPVLVHLSKDKTEQWLLVRMKQPQDATGDQK